jgi:hypothetical protein
MKKIVRLTESDLYRIVKRVISEQVPQNNKVPTQGGPEKKPITTTQKKLKDTNWYAKQIGNIFYGLMSVMNLKNMRDFVDKSQLTPQEKANLNIYAKKMGALISPMASEEEQIQLGKAYFTGVATSGKQIDLATAANRPKDLLYNYNTSSTGPMVLKAKQLLDSQRAKNKTVKVES